ncbi:MAG: glycosyltransferase family 4 protein [Brevundimonas sp.]
MTPAVPPQVTLAFGSGLDVATWPERHAAGEVPDVWPYGLDKLGRSGAAVDTVSLPEPSRAQVAAARARRMLRSGARTPAEPRRIGVAWDEHVARRMLVLAPRPEMFSGAIWVSDLLARDLRDPVAARQLKVLSAMDGVYVNSRAQVDVLAGALGPSGPKVDYFPFGIDGDFFRPSPYPDRPLVVSFGGDRDRDPETLYEALALVHEAAPEAEIVIQSRSQAPLPAGVRLVPRMSHRDLAQLYARASVVVVATRHNLHMSGLTVSLESMASARPVVITETPGADDYFSDGETAHLARCGDAPGIAGKVLAVLADPAAGAAMGVRARREVDDRFTTTHLARSMAKSFGLTKPPG